MKNELVLLVGNEESHLKYIEEHFETYQVINENVIASCLIKEELPSFSAFVCRFIAAIARSHMLVGFPVVVSSNSIELESIFIWKQYAVMYNYELKVFIFSETFNDSDESRIRQTKFNELKSILTMKHQKVTDYVIFVDPEEDK